MTTKTALKVEKSDAEWRAQLTPEQYKVTRQHGTERAFTGPNWDNKADGLYRCVCCDKPLFRSETKFDSGTGWPSFYEPIEKQAVTEHVDKSWFSTRTEIRCADCDAHLGHVFPDGPQPTGLRYCMNGVAMTFEPDGEKAP
jgi:peptide-methionine (R)-S-oxide reductase